MAAIRSGSGHADGIEEGINLFFADVVAAEADLVQIDRSDPLGGGELGEARIRPEGAADIPLRSAGHARSVGRPTWPNKWIRRAEKSPVLVQCLARTRRYAGCGDRGVVVQFSRGRFAEDRFGCGLC